MNKKESSSGVQKAEALADNGSTTKNFVGFEVNLSVGNCRKRAFLVNYAGNSVGEFGRCNSPAKTEKKQPVKQVKKDKNAKKKKPVKSERAIKTLFRTYF